MTEDEFRRWHNERVIEAMARALFERHDFGGLICDWGDCAEDVREHWLNFASAALAAYRAAALVKPSEVPDGVEVLTIGRCGDISMDLNGGTVWRSMDSSCARGYPEIDPAASAAAEGGRVMADLCDYEIEVLKMLDGRPNERQGWGAAMSAALESLCNSGFADLEGEEADCSYVITPAGRAWLDQHIGPKPEQPA